MTKPAAVVSWIKRGAAAKTAFAQEEAKAELRKQEAGKMWDFWMPEDLERQSPSSTASSMRTACSNAACSTSTRPHQRLRTLRLTVDQDQSQPCPICESGDRPALVGVMTIIDHTEHTVQKGRTRAR